MYTTSQLKDLSQRLKTHYPSYDVSFSEGQITMCHVYTRIELDMNEARLYVAQELFDSFSSTDVRDMDDVYELIEAFLLDVQHAGMTEGNDTYISAVNHAGKMSSAALASLGLILTGALIALLVSKSLWALIAVLGIPLISLGVLKLIRKAAFSKYWVCPFCGAPLPLKGWLFKSEIEYAAKCPSCSKILEQPPHLEPVHEEEEQEIPAPSCTDLPAPGKKWLSILCGALSSGVSLFLLPLIFTAEEQPDYLGLTTGVVLLLFILGFGIALLFCRSKAPEEVKPASVILRERAFVGVLGAVLWFIGLVLSLMAIIVAGTAPFEPGVMAVFAVPGIPLFVLGSWMLLAARNRALYLFQDRSGIYCSSFGKRREFFPGQIAAVKLSANGSIKLLDKQGKKLCSAETNMRGSHLLADYIESCALDLSISSAMEKQFAAENEAVQWRDEYKTPWHSHIKGIRYGLWAVMLIFVIAVLIPIPLYIFAGAKFSTVMKIAAAAPVPFIVYCVVFAPVLLFGDRPQNATPEWNSMHVKVPLIPALLIGLVYFWQVSYIWDEIVLQEADTGIGWFLRILVIAALLTSTMILRSPKRLRLGAGLFMGLLSLTIAIGFDYSFNASLAGPARHYPAIILASHADDPKIDDDDYTLTVLLDNGSEVELNVPEKIYAMAADGESLDVCHRESPFGVVLLDIHPPEN